MLWAVLSVYKVVPLFNPGGKDARTIYTDKKSGHTFSVSTSVDCTICPSIHVTCGTAGRSIYGKLRSTWKAVVLSHVHALSN
jgi:hypothetical protein